MKPRKALDVQLRPGWHFEERSKVFMNKTGDQFSPPDLPKGLELRNKAGDLASKPKSSLSEAERNMLRFLQAILPESEKIEDWVSKIRNWPPVARVSSPPEISLPKM